MDALRCGPVAVVGLFEATLCCTPKNALRNDWASHELLDLRVPLALLLLFELTNEETEVDWLTPLAGGRGGCSIVLDLVNIWPTADEADDGWGDDDTEAAMDVEVCWKKLRLCDEAETTILPVVDVSVCGGDDDSWHVDLCFSLVVVVVVVVVGFTEADIEVDDVVLISDDRWRCVVVDKEDDVSISLVVLKRFPLELLLLFLKLLLARLLLLSS